LLIPALKTAKRLAERRIIKQADDGGLSGHHGDVRVQGHAGNV
jgi:hypothetical protein